MNSNTNPIPHEHLISRGGMLITCFIAKKETAT